MGPIHPALVHFPIALLLLSVLADIVGAWKKEPSARIVGFWSLVGATVGANAAVMAGLYDMEKVEGHVDLVHVHMRLGISLLVVMCAVLYWRHRLHRRGGGVGRAYLVVAPVLAVLIGLQGWLGHALVFAEGVGVARADAVGAKGSTEHGPKAVGEGERHGSMSTAEHGEIKDGEMKDGEHGNMKPGDAKTGDTKNGDMKHDDIRHGDMKHDDMKQGDMESGEKRNGEMNHGAMKPGAMNGTEMKTEREMNKASSTTSPSRAVDGRTPIAPRIPSFSISSLPWPPLPATASRPRPASHPANPSAPSAPTYDAPSSLSSDALAPISSAEDEPDAGTRE